MDTGEQARPNEAPLDRAIALSLAGEHRQALAWAGALLRRTGDDAAALLWCARELIQLGEREPALHGLRAACGLAVASGSLPIAVAACCELRTVGAEVAAMLDYVARAFARGSARLVPRGRRPPELPGVDADLTPLTEPEAIQEVVGLFDSCTRAAEEAAAARPGIVAHPLFSTLDFDGLRALIEPFEVAVHGAKSVVIEQGAAGTDVFVVARGELDVLRRSREGSELLLARLGAGALLGEMSLLTGAPRAATVVARRPSLLLVARGGALDAVAAQQSQVGTELAAYCRGRMIANLVRTSPIFSAMEASERTSLMLCFVTRTFAKGERLITQGEETDGLYLIASGELKVLRRDGSEVLRLAELGVGEVVGEMGLVLRRPASADVIARTPTVTLHLPREGFLDLVKAHPTVLARLYEIAAQRDQETSTILAQEATPAEDYVIL